MLTLRSTGNAIDEDNFDLASARVGLKSHSYPCPGIKGVMLVDTSSSPHHRRKRAEILRSYRLPFAQKDPGAHIPRTVGIPSAQRVTSKANFVTLSVFIPYDALSN